MTHSVIHRGYGIEINLSEPDLGHPDRPGLLTEIYGNYRPDRLYCLEAHEYGATCPGFMTLVNRHGRYHAKHVPDGERSETQGESDLHKALKNHTAETASREGFDVKVEDRAKHGKRRTDVTVGGHDGRKLGYEIQFSAIASGSVDRRTKRAVGDGVTPLWLVNNENSIAIDRAPWARLNIQKWQDVDSRDALRVRGGVKRLRMDRCDWTTQRQCPRSSTRCGGWHAVWESTQTHYDDMVRMTAAGELVTLYMRKRDGQRGWHMWVKPKDKEQFLQGHPEPDPYQSARRKPPEELTREALDRDPNCHYGEDTGIREELLRPRDDGDPIDASHWLSQPAPPEFTAVQNVDGYELPGDLVSAQVALTNAFAHCEKLSSSLPSGRDLAAGRAEITNGQRTGVEEAREECRRLALVVHDHPWFESVENRCTARQALFVAARDRCAAE